MHSHTNIYVAGIRRPINKYLLPSASKNHSHQPHLPLVKMTSSQHYSASDSERTYQLVQDLLFEGGRSIMHQTTLSLSLWHAHNTIYLRNFPYKKNRKNIRRVADYILPSILHSIVRWQTTANNMVSRYYGTRKCRIF